MSILKRVQILVALLALGIVGVWAVRAIIPAFPMTERVVRVGVNDSPPYAIVRPDGSPDGFSVEVLNEAARRARIRLQWIACPEGPERALKSGKVDVWHILTDIPERHAWAFFTDPWLRTQFAFAVPDNSPIRTAKDAAGRRVSYTDTVLQARLAKQFFSASGLVPGPLRNVLRAVCRGEADAAFIDKMEMLRRLLSRPPDCDSFPLRLIPLDGANYQMALGATQSGLSAARELRAQIASMAQDRTLDGLHSKWLSDTSDETRIVSELTESRQRSRLFRLCAAILAAVVVLLAVLAYRERMVRQATKSAYEFASTVLDRAGGLVLICDRHGRVVRFNQACEEATGKTLQTVRNKTSWDVFVPDEERQAVQAIFENLAGGVPQSHHEYHWQTLDGPRLFCWSHTVLMNISGRVDYIIATGIDISKREAAEQRLGYEASHDALTNLVNRRQFLRELDAAFGTASCGGSGFSLVLADLDHFKIINDTYGHEGGDHVLAFLAHVFRSELGVCDLAGRLGGDEFCLLIRSSGVESILERIRIHLMNHEFRSLSGQTFHAAFSLGIAKWSDSVLRPVELLRAADQALYEAKDRARHMSRLHLSQAFRQTTIKVA